MRTIHIADGRKYFPVMNLLLDAPNVMGLILDILHGVMG
jgi:hypothetical protein